MKRPGNLPMISDTAPLAKLLRCAFVVGIFIIATFSLAAADTNSAYARWIKPWSERPANSPALAGAGLKVIVSSVRGESEAAAVAAMTPVQRLYLAYHVQVSAAEVATNGSFRSYVISNTDARTGEVRQLSAEDFQMLGLLLDRLPEDNAQLPPAGERIALQVRVHDQWRIRVYDGKALPPEVQDVLSQLAKPYRKLF